MIFTAKDVTLAEYAFFNHRDNGVFFKEECRCVLNEIVVYEWLEEAKIIRKPPSLCEKTSFPPWLKKVFRVVISAENRNHHSAAIPLSPDHT